MAKITTYLWTDAPIGSLAVNETANTATIQASPNTKADLTHVVPNLDGAGFNCVLDDEGLHVHGNKDVNVATLFERLTEMGVTGQSAPQVTVTELRQEPSGRTMASRLRAEMPPQPGLMADLLSSRQASPVSAGATYAAANSLFTERWAGRVGGEQAPHERGAANTPKGTGPAGP